MGGWRRKWFTEQPVSQTGTDPTELHVEVLFRGSFMTKLLGEQSTILILTDWKGESAKAHFKRA